MNREELQKRLEAAFDRYASMQEEHLHALQRATVTELSTLAFERAQAFAELKNLLLAAQKVEAPPLSRLCRDRLSLLLTRDHEISSRIQDYREQLACRLARLQQGRRALIGYGRLEASSPPRFVNTSR